MNMYRWFWSHTEFWLAPGERRPYTFIIRDFYHQSPLLSAAAVFLVGKALAIVSWHDVFVFLAGMLFAHLFWGTPYVPNEHLRFGTWRKTFGRDEAKAG